MGDDRALSPTVRMLEPPHKLSATEREFVGKMAKEPGAENARRRRYAQELLRRHPGEKKSPEDAKENAPQDPAKGSDAGSA
jgi:hypothetical protein